MDKRVLFGIAVSLVVVCLVLTAGCTNNAEKTYVVGIDAEYPPYAYIDESGKATGFDVESMQWIADNAGIKVEFKALEWSSIVPSLQTQKCDLIYSGMSITADRASKVAFSIPYWEIDLAVAAKNGSDVTMDDFYAGKTTIGVQSGCSAVDYLELHFGKEVYDKMVKDGNIKFYQSFPLSMVDLENGQVQTVIFDDAGIDENVKDSKTLYKLGITDVGEQFAVAVRNGDTELLKIVNDGLTKLMASEKWNELKTKYELTEA